MYIIDNILYRDNQDRTLSQEFNDIYINLIKKYCKLDMKLGGFLSLDLYICKNGCFIYWGSYNPDYMVGDIQIGTNKFNNTYDGITIFAGNYIYVFNKVL